jgi:electron transfer flavoprotein alpha subunit
VHLACRLSTKNLRINEQRRDLQISSLVLAEHAGGRLQLNTHHVVTAAQKVGGPVTVLVAGLNVKEVANEASKLAGIESVSFWG